MNRIFKTFTNEWLYGGVDKESFNLDKSSFRSANRRIVMGLTFLMTGLFYYITIRAIQDNGFSDGKPLFPIAAVVFTVLDVICLADKKGKTTDVLSSLIRIILFSYGLAQSLVMNNKSVTICLFVFLCAAPALFIARPIVLLGEIIATNIVYFSLCDTLKPGAEFESDKVWLILYSIGGIIIAMINVRQKIRSIDNARLLGIQSEEARLAREDADKANNAKGQFLANMSHEIRTPINAVLGMDTMILRTSKDKEILRYARNIQGAGKSLLSLINDILDFSKIESGKMELVSAEYAFTDLINDIFNMISAKANDKDLELELDIDENIPCMMLGDDVRIRQVLINLLTNAVKYTPNGKVYLRIRSNGTDEAGKISLHFAVEDTGIGIKPEDIGKLSEEFVRIEESRNRNIEGTGLGITIVVSLLAMMGSKLEVESIYGEGSVFFFDITQKVIDPEPVGNIRERISCALDEAELYTIKYTVPDVAILVVDDNAMNRTVFKSLLRELKCRIDEADSGAKCLEAVKNNKYDIIFMDHMMPEMDGIQTLAI